MIQIHVRVKKYLSTCICQVGLGSALLFTETPEGTGVLKAYSNWNPSTPPPHGSLLISLLLLPSVRFVLSGNRSKHVRECHPWVWKREREDIKWSEINHSLVTKFRPFCLMWPQLKIWAFMSIPAHSPPASSLLCHQVTLNEKKCFSLECDYAIH